VHFSDHCRKNRAISFCVERVKRFVNVRLPGIISNLKSGSKITTLPPLEKFLLTTIERGLGAILTKDCRSLLYAVLLNGASASVG